MTTDDTAALVREVAEGLGWTERMRSPMMNDKRPVLWSTPWGITANRVLLAAYAEAVMIGRGWTDASHEGFGGFLLERHMAEYTEEYECDWTDPNSKALAVLRAVKEALSMERMSKPGAINAEPNHV